MPLTIYDTLAPQGNYPTTMARHVGLPGGGNVLAELDRINEILTAFFDSDNQSLDELSEIVNYIVRNKTLIDAVTQDVAAVAQSVVPEVLPGTATIEPEKYYDFGSVESLTVTLAEKADGRAHEYTFEFTPAEAFQRLTITPAPVWLREPQYPVGKRCVVSIVQGMAVMGCG